MTDTIFIALISAAAALIGAAIPSLFSFLSISRKYNKEKQLKLDELRFNTYNSFLFALQEFMNSPNDSTKFIQFQLSVNRSILCANYNTAKLINEYWIKLISQNRGNQLTNTQHNYYHELIINSMRLDIDSNSEHIEKIHLTAFLSSFHKN